MSDFNAILERLRKLEASEEVHNDVEESRMGYSDVERLGSAAASKIDNVLRRKIYDMGKDIRDIEPGTLDRMRYQVAKELGLVESTEIDEAKADPKIVAKFAKVRPSQRSYYIMQWAKEEGIDGNKAMEMAGYVKGEYMGAGAYRWNYVGEGQVDEGSGTFGSASKKAEASRQRAIEKAKSWMKSTGKSAEDAVKEFDLFSSDIGKLKEEAVELDAVEEGYYNDEEKYVDHSFNKMLDFVNTATKMVEKPRLADNITSIGGDPSSLKDIKQKLDDLYNNVEDGHYEAMAHLGMEESEEAIEPTDMREQRLAQRVNELTKRLQSFKEQLSEMDPEMDPEEIKQQQTITSNLNQLKSAGVDIDPNKGTDDPTFNKEIGDKVAAAMADPALANQVKGVLSKVKD